MSKLLAINVNEHTEKKNNLTYLSWAWAWAEVLKIDALACWELQEYLTDAGVTLPCMFLPDGTAMVKVKVTINGDTKACLLPVMDNRNKAIKNPDAFAINTATMRCLAKAISMHGLGLYIYAGEDLPQVAAEPEPKSAEEVARDKRNSELEELALFLVDCHEHDNDMQAIDCWYAVETWSEGAEAKQEEQAYVWGLLRATSKLRSAIKANHPDRLKAAAEKAAMEANA